MPSGYYVAKAGVSEFTWGRMRRSTAAHRLQRVVQPTT